MEKIYARGKIKDFEIKILAAGECESFLPMVFINEKETLRVGYNTQGYRKISEKEIKNPYQLLIILEKTVQNLKNAGNHFILQYSYNVDCNSMFINEDMTNVKFMFIPAEEIAGGKSEEEFAEKVICIIEDIKQMVEDERCREYIDRIQDKVKKFNLSKQGLINYLSELKREAYMCGWEQG